MRADCLLFANGRSGNTEMLNLPEVGLEPDSRGQVRVNERYQTAAKHVFAVGDVIGYPSLASAAYNQGRFAAESMLVSKLHMTMTVQNCKQHSQTLSIEPHSNPFWRTTKT